MVSGSASADWPCRVVLREVLGVLCETADGERFVCPWRWLRRMK